MVLRPDHKIMAICEGIPIMNIGHITSLRSCKKIAVIAVQSKNENRNNPIFRFPQALLNINATVKLTGSAHIKRVHRLCPELTLTYV